LGSLLALYDMRGDENQQLGAAELIIVGAKQRPNHGNIVQNRDAIVAFVLLAGDQALPVRGLAIADSNRAADLPL